MAITQAALARAIARDLVHTAPPEAGIKRVWVWSEHGHIDPERDYVELTIFNDPADEQAQRRLQEAVANLHDRYPDVNIFAYLYGPHAPARRAPSQWLRPEAEEIDLNAE